QEPGQYFPSLTVIDQAGNYATHTAEIRVLSDPPPQDNQPPVAEIVALTSTTGTAPLRVEVDAYNSFDPDGEIIEYRWTTSHGMTWVGPYFVSTFGEVGDFTISLAVTDSAGAVGTDHVQVRAENEVPPPQVPEVYIELRDLANRSSGTVGNGEVLQVTQLPAIIEYDGMMSTYGDGNSLIYRWDFSDGGTSSSGYGQHQFTQEGIYTVSLQIENELGQISQTSATIEIDVADYRCLREEGDEACHSINELDGKVLPIDGSPSQTLSLRNNFAVPYGTYSSSLGDSGESVVLVAREDSSLVRSSVDITDLTQSVGSYLEINVQDLLQRVPNLRWAYAIEIRGQSFDSSVGLNGSSQEFYFGTARGVVHLPEGIYTLEVDEGNFKYLKTLPQVTGTVTLEFLPPGGYNVRAISEDGQSFWGEFLVPNPYSEASTQVAAIQNPYSPSGQVVQQQTVNGLSARTTSMAAEPEIPTNLPPTSIADLEARTPGFPEPFELPKSSGVTLKTASLKSAAVTTQNLVPEPFLPEKGYEYRPGWARKCTFDPYAELAPFSGVLREAGPKGNPAYDLSPVSSSNYGGASYSWISVGQKSIKVSCNVQSWRILNAYYSWYATTVSQDCCAIGEALQECKKRWKSETASSNTWRAQRGGHRHKLSMWFGRNHQYYVSNKAVVKQFSFNNWVTNEADQDDGVALSRIGLPYDFGDPNKIDFDLVPNYGVNFTFDVPVPKETYSSNGGFVTFLVQRHRPLGDSQPELFDRMNCVVVTPRSSAIELTELSTSPPLTTDAGTYNPMEDGARLESGSEGLFPLDIDQSAAASNTYRNRGGRFVPRFRVRARYNSNHVTWTGVRAYVGNETSSMLHFDLPLQSGVYPEPQGKARSTTALTTDSSVNSTSMNSVMIPIS
ncbi:MAG: PKD domain-containing protein, partial [Bdellovibrionales bacterium]|nr:PKD domain-containing protein [Bdellovibrionales bacterium]